MGSEIGLPHGYGWTPTMDRVWDLVDNQTNPLEATTVIATISPTTCAALL